MIVKKKYDIETQLSATGAFRVQCGIRYQRIKEAGVDIYAIDIKAVK